MRLLFLSLVALAVTGGVIHGGDKIPLRVSGLPSSGVSPAAIAEARVLDEFRKRHPEVEIQPAEGLKIEGLGDEIAPLMMIAGGISPDVLNVTFRKIDSYVRQGILYPLNEFMAEEEAKNPNWKKSRILPQIEPVVNRPDAEGAAHYYALPVQYAVMGLYYNRPLFRQAGLPPRAPKDWAELVEFAKKINALDPLNKGLVVNSGQQSSWNWMNFLWSTVEEVKPKEWRATFNSDQAVDAFEFYYRLTEGEKIATRGSVTQMIAGGEARRIGMQFGYIGRQINLDPSIWSFGAVPLGPTGIRGAEINAHMLGIFSGIKDSRVRRAAWQYVNFIGSEEAQKIRTDTFIEMGMVNQLNPSDLRKFGYTSFLDLAEPGLEAEFETAIATAKPEPYGKNCNLVYIEMTYPLDQILLSPLVAEAWRRGDAKGLRTGIRQILQRGVAVTNERMLGLVSPEKMRQRRIAAFVTVALILAAFVFVARSIFRSFSLVGQATTRARQGQVLAAWSLLVIPLALTALWHYLPLARGAWMSLLDYQLLLKSTFVGLDNFANVLFDARFWGSMLATFHFAFWMLTAGFLTPIVLAYLLHLVPRHTVLFRVVYYLPALLTGTAVFVLWKQFFGANGMVNEVLGLFGIALHRAWPEDPALAMLSCVLPGVWAGAGPGCLIYLAALKTIPEEQFEASEIDGAGFFNKTIHIVIPALMPLIVINFVGAVMAAFQASQNILIMTAGGPKGLTEVAALRIFYEAFMFLHFGPATAMAWILGSLLVGFALVQLKRLSRMEFKSSNR